MNYSCDGGSLRVTKSNGTNGTIYWRVEGSTLSETNLTGALTGEYIFFAGSRIARRDSSNNVYYYFTDHLGSTRVVTSATGILCYQADYTPYGGEITPAGFTNTCSQNYKFAGYERDTETGLDYAMARYYNNHLGRFISVDPIGGSLGNSQSWNAYSYVHNNPSNLTDPSGMDPDFWVWLSFNAGSGSVDTSGFDGYLNNGYGPPMGPDVMTGGPYFYPGTYSSVDANGVWSTTTVTIGTPIPVYHAAQWSISMPGNSALSFGNSIIPAIIIVARP